MKILIIEDDTEISLLLKQVLELENHSVSCCGDGQEALDHLVDDSNHPELIIVDLIMPRMDGVEFRLAQLKNPKICDIPVLLMTADGSFSASEAKLRPDQLLKKPLSIDTVLDKIQKAKIKTGG